MRKQKVGAIVLSIAATFVFGSISAYDYLDFHNNAGADESGYSIAFTASNYVFDDSLNTQEISTTLGNAILFSNDGYSEAVGVWGNLASGGYIYNETAISGLVSLSVTYGEATGNLSIAYGWWDDTENSIVYEVIEGSITASSTVFDFNGFSPSFFKIVSATDIQIESMTIQYSCYETENPFPSSLSQLTMQLLESTYSVTDCNESATSIAIPSTFNGLPITNIKEGAFAECRSLISVFIPNSVTSIGLGAFYHCISMTSIRISNNVTSINGSTFELCIALTSVIIPDGVTYIGSSAFGTCQSLTSITIPDSVTLFESGAFEYCTLLTSITLSNNLTLIGDLAFRACTSLQSIVIPISVTIIGNGAFATCQSLTIFCEALSKPDGWYTYWNPDNRPVVWGYTS